MTAPGNTSSLLHVGTVTNETSLNYVANSYIYPEDPNTMVVTTRGTGGGKPAAWKIPGFRGTRHASVTIFDISDGAQPKIKAQWDAPSRVEGQDRHGDTLVVTNITHGILYTFDPDNVSSGPVGTCDLSVNGALHVRLYPHGPTRRLFALVTSGFATRFALPGAARALIAVDVTDKGNPFEVAKTMDGVPWSPEGIFVHQGRAYVGGVNDKKLSSYDLSKLIDAKPCMQRLQTVTNPAYKQCVAQNSDPRNDTEPYMYAALWSRPGGLGIFNVGASDGVVVEVGRLVDPALSMTNRVVLFRDRTMALLPLEAHPGGIALVDTSDTTRPQLVHSVEFTEKNDTCYCACTHGDYVYAFAAHGCAMHVFQLAPRP
eukprot:m.83509 g.83509  ORF g.83509 m.83509 type:complete len:372 (+) comp16348_c0_seq2:177-1292(+)